MDNKDKALKANADQWDEFINSKCWKEMEEALDNWIEEVKMEKAPETQDDIIMSTVAPHIRDKLLAVKYLPRLTKEFMEQEEKDGQKT